MTRDQYETIKRELNEDIMFHIREIYWSLVTELTSKDNMNSFSCRGNRIKYFLNMMRKVHKDIHKSEVILNSVVDRLEDEIEGETDE